MTTAAKRAKKKANRTAERLAATLDAMDALADLSDEELAEVTVVRERPESEKAAAMTALATVKSMRKRLKRD